MWIILSILAVGVAHGTQPKEAKAVKKPCMALMNACKAAGYVKGGSKDDKKGLIRDCMKPLVEGMAVPGVTAKSEDIAACKERHERREERRRMKGERDTPQKARKK